MDTQQASQTLIRPPEGAAKKDHKRPSLSADAEARNLMEHGTDTGARLTPRNLVQCAEADMRSHAHNQRREAQIRTLKANHQNWKVHVDPKRSLNFLSEHVRDAKTPADVLRRAAAGVADGRGKGSVARQRVYARDDTLAAALALAEREAEAAAQEAEARRLAEADTADGGA